jgi:hypothetical protein
MNLPALSKWFRRSQDATTIINDTSFLTQETAEVYHACLADCLASRHLTEFRRDAYLYHKNSVRPEPNDDPVKVENGDALRVLVLEGPEQLKARYAIGGPVDATGKPCGRYSREFEKWAAAQDRPVISHEQMQLVETLHDSVRGHRLAGELLSCGVAGGVVRTIYHRLACQGRIEWLNPRAGLVGLHTTGNLGWFDYEAKASGHVHDMAFLRALVLHVTGAVLPTFLIAVEDRWPHRCGIWAVGKGVLEAAQKENEQAMERLAACRQLNRWPTGFEKLRTID